MPTTDELQAQQKAAAKSPSYAKASQGTRRAGWRGVLRTAQIYAVGEAEAVPTGDIVLVVLVGDEECEPHHHGLRAPRIRWVEAFARMAAKDPELTALLRARLG